MWFGRVPSLLSMSEVPCELEDRQVALGGFIEMGCGYQGDGKGGPVS